MKPDTRDPLDPPPPTPSDWHEIEVQVQHLEQALQAIKQRLTQVRTLQSDRRHLEQQQQEVRDRLQRLPPQTSPQNRDATSPQQELKQQLAQISSQLELLEVELESRLISWSSFREPFWQIVRFGGLGVLIGFAIKSCTG